jgi:hypothetical protein
MESMDGEESIIKRMNGPSNMRVAGTAWNQLELVLITGEHQLSREHVDSSPVARHGVFMNWRYQVPGQIQASIPDHSIFIISTLLHPARPEQSLASRVVHLPGGLTALVMSIAAS